MLKCVTSRLTLSFFGFRPGRQLRIAAISLQFPLRDC
jgi:hypothetical protein